MILACCDDYCLRVIICAVEGQAHCCLTATHYITLNTHLRPVTSYSHNTQTELSQKHLPSIYHYTEEVLMLLQEIWNIQMLWTLFSLAFWLVANWNDGLTSCCFSDCVRAKEEKAQEKRQTAVNIYRQWLMRSPSSNCSISAPSGLASRP